MNASSEDQTKQLTLQIGGMTCAACATRIEKGLGRLDGVEEVNVNLALERASVTYTPSTVNKEQVEQKIEQLGYQSLKETVDLDIAGMTCAACATRIEKGIKRMEGVSSVNVNLALETARVQYTPGSLETTDIIRKVEKLGYTASPKKRRRSSTTSST